MKDDKKQNGYLTSIMAMILISFGVAGWLTKTHYSGHDVSQIIWRFFIFLMGATAALTVPWMAIHYIVIQIFEKNKAWIFWVLCFVAMIAAYLITP